MSKPVFIFPRMILSLSPRGPGALTALAAAALLAACSMTPEYKRPDAPVAADWPVLPASPGNAGAGTATVPAADLNWQDFVSDANLRELIRLALINNRDLRVAALNIEQARAQYQIRRADQFPTVNLGATGLRQPNPSGNGDIASWYTAGLAFSAWELDFFGRLGSLKEAAQAQFLATEEARKAVQISLIASVASTWLSLQTNAELLVLTQDTLNSREDSLRLIKLRFDNGASSALDLRLAESLAAGARATVAQQRRLRALDVNALTLLVGQPLPQSLLAPVSLPRSVVSAGQESLFQDLPVDLPSDLLARRPDIRQAEQQLISANANIGAARAAFFPRISLTASAGSASNDLNSLFKDGTWGFTLAPQALLPIFDAGRNRAGLESASAGRDIAVAQYEKAIQTAFREVADALAGRATLSDQLLAQQTQTDAETARLELTRLRYRNGIASSLDLLDAQRSLFVVQLALAQTRLALLQNQVALYKSLGGGWTEVPAKP
jgi:multidrug efflux system outer membrane protein